MTRRPRGISIDEPDDFGDAFGRIQHGAYELESTELELRRQQFDGEFFNTALGEPHAHIIIHYDTVEGFAHVSSLNDLRYLREMMRWPRDWVGPMWDIDAAFRPDRFCRPDPRAQGEDTGRWTSTRHVQVWQHVTQQTSMRHHVHRVLSAILRPRLAELMRGQRQAVDQRSLNDFAERVMGGALGLPDVPGEVIVRYAIGEDDRIASEVSWRLTRASIENGDAICRWVLRPFNLNDGWAVHSPTALETAQAWPSSRDNYRIGPPVRQEAGAAVLDNRNILRGELDAPDNRVIPPEAIEQATQSAEEIPWFHTARVSADNENAVQVSLWQRGGDDVGPTQLATAWMTIGEQRIMDIPQPLICGDHMLAGYGFVVHLDENRGPPRPLSVLAQIRVRPVGMEGGMPTYGAEVTHARDVVAATPEAVAAQQEYIASVTANTLMNTQADGGDDAMMLALDDLRRQHTGDPARFERIVTFLNHRRVAEGREPIELSPTATVTSPPEAAEILLRMSHDEMMRDMRELRANAEPGYFYRVLNELNRMLAANNRDTITAAFLLPNDTERIPTLFSHDEVPTPGDRITLQDGREGILTGIDPADPDGSVTVHMNITPEQAAEQRQALASCNSCGLPLVNDERMVCAACQVRLGGTSQEIPFRFANAVTEPNRANRNNDVFDMDVLRRMLGNDAEATPVQQVSSQEELDALVGPLREPAEPPESLREVLAATMATVDEVRQEILNTPPEEVAAARAAAETSRLVSTPRGTGNSLQQLFEQAAVQGNLPATQTPAEMMDIAEQTVRHLMEVTEEDRESLLLDIQIRNPMMHALVIDRLRHVREAAVEPIPDREDQSTSVAMENSRALNEAIFDQMMTPPVTDREQVLDTRRMSLDNVWQMDIRNVLNGEPAHSIGDMIVLNDDGYCRATIIELHNGPYGDAAREATVEVRAPTPVLMLQRADEWANARYELDSEGWQEALDELQAEDLTLYELVLELHHVEDVNRDEAAERAVDYFIRRFLEQRAINAVNDFTRQRMSEDRQRDGYYRRIMPPIPIANDEIDQMVTGDEPVRLDDGIEMPVDQLLQDVEEVYIDDRAVETNRPVREVDAEEVTGGVTRETMADAARLLPEAAAAQQQQGQGFIDPATLADMQRWNQPDEQTRREILVNGPSEALPSPTRGQWLILAREFAERNENQFAYIHPEFWRASRDLFRDEMGDYLQRTRYRVEATGLSVCGLTLFESPNVPLGQMMSLGELAVASGVEPAGYDEVITPARFRQMVFGLNYRLGSEHPPNTAVFISPSDREDIMRWSRDVMGDQPLPTAVAAREPADNWISIFGTVLVADAHVPVGYLLTRDELRVRTPGNAVVENLSTRPGQRVYEQLAPRERQRSIEVEE